MNEQYEKNTAMTFAEALLLDYFTGYEPDKRFSEKLHNELANRAADMQNHQSHTYRLFNWIGQLRTRQLRRLALGLGVLVLLIAGVTLRQPLLAAAQQLLGYSYVADMGFIELASARVLVGPTSQTRGQQVITVTNVVATGDRTKVWLEYRGIDNASSPWSGYDLTTTVPDTWLEVEGSVSLKPREWGVTDGRLDYLVFDALPADVSKANLVLPSSWQFPLRLVPASDKDEPVLMVYPDTCSTVPEMEICVLMVAVDGDGTHVLLRGSAAPDDSERRVSHGWVSDNPLTGAFNEVRLVDSNGRVYEPISSGDTLSDFAVEAAQEEPPGGLRQAYQVLHFERAASDASTLSLRIPALSVQVPVGETFVLDPGAAPTPGESYDLDIDFEVDGSPIHFDRAEVIEDERYGTVLRVSSLPIVPRDSQVVTLLSAQVSPLPGDSEGVVGAEGIGPTNRQLVIWFDLEGDDGEVIGGERRITIDWATVTLLGPFEIAWHMPTPYLISCTGNTCSEWEGPTDVDTRMVFIQDN